MKPTVSTAFGSGSDTRVTQSHGMVVARRPSKPLADKATEDHVCRMNPSKSEIRGLADDCRYRFCRWKR